MYVRAKKEDRRKERLRASTAHLDVGKEREVERLEKDKKKKRERVDRCSKNENERQMQSINDSSP